MARLHNHRTSGVGVGQSTVVCVYTKKYSCAGSFIPTSASNFKNTHGTDNDLCAASKPCFPSSATILMANGTASQLDKLREGDTVLAGTANGTLVTDTISMFSLADAATKATFVALSTSSNSTLTLTPTHHLPVGGNCCTHLKQAKDVVVGDTVWVVNRNQVVAHSVVHISFTIEQGLHNPLLTNGGFPIINTVLTSFNTMNSVTLARHSVPVLVPLCKATGTCSALRWIVAGMGCAIMGSCKRFKYVDGFEVDLHKSHETVPHISSWLNLPSQIMSSGLRTETCH